MREKIGNLQHEFTSYFPLEKDHDSEPTVSFLLTIENGRIAVKYRGTYGGEVTRTFLANATKVDLMQFLTSKANEAECALCELDVWACASIYFAEEYTDNPDVLELADFICRH